MSGARVALMIFVLMISASTMLVLSSCSPVSAATNSAVTNSGCADAGQVGNPYCMHMKFNMTWTPAGAGYNYAGSGTATFTPDPPNGTPVLLVFSECSASGCPKGAVGATSALV